MSSNRKQSRKRNREVLESLADCRDDSENEVKTGKTILFQNGDASFTLDSESNYYTNGKTDYDENLIGADYYWHQIIVSCRDINNNFDNNISSSLHRFRTRKSSMPKKFFTRFTRLLATISSLRLRIAHRGTLTTSSFIVKERL